MGTGFPSSMLSNSSFSPGSPKSLVTGGWLSRLGLLGPSLMHCVSPLVPLQLGGLWKEREEVIHSLVQVGTCPDGGPQRRGVSGC